MFTNNSVLEASAIFMTTAKQCSWITYAPPYFNDSSILGWPVLNTR